MEPKRKRTAIVTGGSSGIGRATAELLHEQGWRVGVFSNDPDQLAAMPDGFDRHAVGGRRLRREVNSPLIDEQTRQPTNIRENTSMTNATYTSPIQVATRAPCVCDHQLVAPLPARQATEKAA